MKLVRNSWTIPIGKVSKRKWVYFNALEVPHMKVAGVTGSGKSAFMKWLLYCILRQQDADRVQVYIIDLKGGATFAPWEHHPSVAGVYDDIGRALMVLQDIETEMHRRNQVAKLKRYNFQPIPRWPHIIVLIDEGGEMSPKGYSGDDKKLRDACMTTLSSLARVGREPCIHVIHGTQRPDADTLPTHIRSQLEGTFCFRVKEDIDSRIVLRHNGAEQLPKNPGRMIYQTPATEMIVQAPYLSDKVIEQWLKSYWTPEDEAAAAVIDVPSLSLPEGSSEWT